MLHVVADPDVVGEDVFFERLPAVATAVARVDAVLQLRFKRDIERIRRAVELVPSDVTLAINGVVARRRVERATLLHLPEADIGEALPPFSASVHGPEALASAQAAGASYVFFGPVFDPGSKPVDGVGVHALAEIAEVASVPVVAIGGITPERIGMCVAAGARGVAFLTPAFETDDPASLIQRYAEELQEALEDAMCRSATTRRIESLAWMAEQLATDDRMFLEACFLRLRNEIAEQQARAANALRDVAPASRPLTVEERGQIETALAELRSTAVDLNLWMRQAERSAEILEAKAQTAAEAGREDLGEDALAAAGRDRETIALLLEEIEATKAAFRDAELLVARVAPEAARKIDAEQDPQS